MVGRADRLVDQHGVVREEAVAQAALVLAVELHGGREDEHVHCLLQCRVVLVSQDDVAYVGLLVGVRVRAFLRRDHRVQVVEVPHSHVAVGTGERHDEVLREDVLGVARVHEDVREGCCRVADVLGPRQDAQEFGDLLVDRRAVGVGFARVHRCLVRLVVDDQDRDLRQWCLDLSQVLDQLAEDGLVLLDHHQACRGAVQVAWVVEGEGRFLLLGLERHYALEQRLVVVVARGHADDVEAAKGGGQAAVGEELALGPGRVVRVVRLVFGGAAQDVLAAGEFHVQAPLRLGAQQVQSAAEDDDQAVARVDGLGDDAGEVGGLAGLHVADDQALGLVRGFLGGVGEAFHDLVGGGVEAG